MTEQPSMIFKPGQAVPSVDAEKLVKKIEQNFNAAFSIAHGVQSDARSRSIQETYAKLHEKVKRFKEMKQQNLDDVLSEYKTQLELQLTSGVKADLDHALTRVFVPVGTINAAYQHCSKLLQFMKQFEGAGDYPRSLKLLGFIQSIYKETNKALQSLHQRAPRKK